MTEQAPADLSHLTPLERHNELSDEVHSLSGRFDNLSGRFDAFASDANVKFSKIERAQDELYRGQSQTNELLIGLRSDFKNRRDGLDVRGLMAIGGGLLAAAVAMATLFGLVVAGVLHLAGTRADQAANAVQHNAHIANAEQDMQLVELRKDKEILELKMRLGDQTQE